jgi:hypothetical protein
MAWTRRCKEVRCQSLPHGLTYRFFFAMKMASIIFSLVSLFFGFNGAYSVLQQHMHTSKMGKAGEGMRLILD